MAPKRISTRLHDLIETRRRDRRWGLGMLVVGLIVLLDSPYPIPFPLVGLPSVIVSAVLVFWAVYRLYRGCGLPLREVAIYLAMKGGEASRTEILEFLEGEEGKGDQLFEILEKKEIATLATHNLEMVEERDVIPEGLVVLLPGGRKLVKGLIEGPGKEG